MFGGGVSVRSEDVVARRVEGVYGIEVTLEEGEHGMVVA